MGCMRIKKCYEVKLKGKLAHPIIIQGKQTKAITRTAPWSKIAIGPLVSNISRVQLSKGKSP